MKFLSLIFQDNFYYESQWRQTIFLSAILHLMGIALFAFFVDISPRKSFKVPPVYMVNLVSFPSSAASSLKIRESKRGGSKTNSLLIGKNLPARKKAASFSKSLLLKKDRPVIADNQKSKKKSTLAQPSLKKKRRPLPPPSREEEEKIEEALENIKREVNLRSIEEKIKRLNEAVSEKDRPRKFAEKERAEIPSETLSSQPVSSMTNVYSLKGKGISREADIRPRPR